MTIPQFINDFINLIFPETCIACGGELPPKEKYLCPHCLLDLPKTNYHKEPENPVEQIFWGRIPIQYATSYFFYTKGSRYQRLIHEMKYNGKKNIGYELGGKMGNELKSSPFSEVDYIVPVPLHKKKLRKRGFNQSEWIGKGMAEKLNKPLSTDILYRAEYTDSQTKKSKYERWLNVEKVFKLKDKFTFRNKHILLVDDILTTGATLEACANTILETKNTSISIATLGFSDK
ncbi:MAG: ComF family protein [Bacteroidales bacterium]